MADSEIKPEWKLLMAGGFAYMTAPFAMHPSDKKRAKDAVTLARSAGISAADFVEEARRYLETAKGWPTDIDEQLGHVRKFVSGKL